MKKQSHFILVLIAVLFTGLIFSCNKDSNNDNNNNSNNNNTSTDNYPWMKTGNEWRYNSLSSLLTDTITDAAIKLIVRQLSSNSFVYRVYNDYGSNDSGVYVVSNDTLYIQSYNYGVLSAKQKLFYIGMHVGDTWVTTNQSTTCTQTVLSVNDVVTTPLGTFTCYRVRSQATGNTGFNETYYDVENHVGDIKGNTYLNNSGTDSLIQSVFIQHKNF